MKNKKKSEVLQRIRMRTPLCTKLKVYFAMECTNRIIENGKEITDAQSEDCMKWIDTQVAEILKICKPYLKKTQPKTIEPFTMCRFNHDEYQKTGYDSPFLPQDKVIFLGEIRHMEGHCVVINTTTGKVETGWHTDLFTEIPEDEI